MRVLVLGGYGLVGSYIVARLHAEGHVVVGLGRDVATATWRLSYARWIKGDMRRMLQPGDWTAALEGVDAVVNCAGALQDSGRDDLAAVHVAAASALYQACLVAGVRRVVLISAANVERGRATRFNNTKLAGEAALKAVDLDWIILRPGLVLATAAYGGTALLRGLAGLPGVILAAYPESVVQVVSAQDVAEAVARSIGAGVTPRQSVDLMSAERTRLADLIRALRAWLGIAPAPVVVVPTPLAILVARLNDATAWFGWRSPMRTTSIAQLAGNVLGDSGQAKVALGFTPNTLAQMLAGWPSGVQERWFAKLYFLKPVILLTVIGFWLASGIIGLTIGFSAALATLPASLSLPQATAIVIAGGLADIALAIAAGFRRATPMALKGMVALSAAYLLGATILTPRLWIDPLGPLVKVVPGMVLALVALAIMDER